MTNIAATVKKCISDQLGILQSEITPEHTFDALGADSLDMVELEMYIEDELGIVVDDPWAPDGTDITVEAYIAAVEKYLAEHPQAVEQLQH